MARLGSKLEKKTNTKKTVKFSHKVEFNESQ